MGRGRPLSPWWKRDCVPGVISPPWAAWCLWSILPTALWELNLTLFSITCHIVSHAATVAWHAKRPDSPLIGSRKRDLKARCGEDEEEEELMCTYGSFCNIMLWAIIIFIDGVVCWGFYVLFIIWVIMIGGSTTSLILEHYCGHMLIVGAIIMLVGIFYSPIRGL